MPDHAGRRRRQARLPTGRLVAIAVALVVVLRLVTLPDPPREPVSTGDPGVVESPGWTGPDPIDVPGLLPDGEPYLPRLFLTPEISVGVAANADSSVQRVVVRGPADQVTELRRLTGADYVRFDGFVVDGDTLLWMESVSRAGSGVGVSLWRVDWRSGARPTLVTSSTGEANFFGGQHDIVVADGRAYWAAIGEGNTTEVRSVPISGGQVTRKEIAGAWQLTGWPWAVSVGGGRGTPVRLLNLTTDEEIQVTTGPGELATCGPAWCRMVVLEGSAITHIDLQRPDGTQRRSMAGEEATPTIPDAVLLDRFVPLATDTPDGDVGLSIYDTMTGRLDLVTAPASNIQGRGATVWWSTGLGGDLVWHALDLRALI